MAEARRLPGARRRPPADELGEGRGAAMDALAQASMASYRRIVETPGFVDYFYAATPINEIAGLNIGSRPTSRQGARSLAALRAIPWVFSWTQSRHMLPAWFGAGVGLRTAVEELGLDVARSAYAEWNYFTTLIDDLEASLARADLVIAAAYEELGDGRQRHFGVKLREEFKLVAEQVLSIKQQSALLDRDPTMQRSIELRNPYVDPINLLQVDLLRRWRQTARQDRDLFESLLACIAGIAEGLQSTG